VNPKAAPIPIIDGSLNWSSAIGLFMLNFGHLEFQVLVYLEKHLSAAEFEKMRARPFKERVDRAAELFGRTAAKREEFAAFVGSLTPVRELRNRLAHGYLEFLLLPGSKVPIIGITRTADFNGEFAAETRHLTFDQLTGQLSALANVTRRFCELTDRDAGWIPLPHR